MVEGEAGVGEEPGDQLVAGADPLDPLLGSVGDFTKGDGGQVGQLRTLQVRPEVFDGVEVRCVGGQPLGAQPVALASMKARIRVLQCADSPSQMSTTRWPA
jgi:hypothetical protein